MKFFHLIMLFLFVSIAAVAQQNHFIYIQTENNQPFYVKLSDRLLSSSAVGYMVIPKLQEGTYDLNIGFPKNEWPLQKISVTVNNKDAGYLLKNFDSKGWGLYNMQTMDIVMSSTGNNAINTSNESVTDGFADVLADVVNTPSIKQKTITTEKKEEIKATEKKQEIITAEKKEEVKEPATKAAVVELKTEPVQVIEVKKVTEQERPIVKLFSTLDENGRSSVYTDTYENSTDTIRIFMPYKKAEIINKNIEKQVEAISPEIKPVIKQEDQSEKISETQSDTKFLDMELANPNAKNDSLAENKKEMEINNIKKNESASIEKVNKVSETGKAGNSVMINSDCRSSASEDDFLNLRKKMASEKTDDDMISAAKKSMRSKCYSTEQIGNLAVLFLNDEGRYNFFDVAYSRVHDTHNFPSLVNKLTDEYYIARFNAMIRH